MKNARRKLAMALVLASLGVTVSARAAEATFGAGGAAKRPDAELTLPAMLVFAIQDEYLARAEYQQVIEKFGARRPFSNIINGEDMRIGMLKPLFEKYAVSIPSDKGLALSPVPASFAGALKVGADLDLANIAMYERFLKKELPADVRSVFEHLLTGSRNHLAALQRDGRGR